MPMKTQRRDRRIACTHSQPNTRRRWVISTTFQLLFPQEWPGTHCTEGSMGFRAGLPSTENLVSVGIRSPELPACNESLCQLCYPGHLKSYAYLEIDLWFVLPKFVIQFVVILRCLQVSFQCTFKKPTNFLCKNIRLLFNLIQSTHLCKTPVCI